MFIGAIRWPWYLITIMIASTIMVPVIIVMSHLGTDSQGIWHHLVTTVLTNYILNTLLLMVGVGSLAAVLGIASAWLVSMTRFPGVQILEWALLLPLAMPPYIVAYVYMDLLEFAGPVQTWLRVTFDLEPDAYWFPQIRSLGGAILVMGAVLYPYIYMLARTAFLSQCVCMLEVSRTLGHGPWRSFLIVGLPLARPAVMSGLALVLMETVADYGTVDYFGIPTFTVGIYRTWFGFGSVTAAAQLASCLLIIVAMLIVLEQWSRGHQVYAHPATYYRPITRIDLKGIKAISAALLCWTIVSIGFLIPTTFLIYLAVQVGDPLWGSRFFDFALTSFLLGLITAGLAVTLAVLLAYGRRLTSGPVSHLAIRIATMGYAIPGSVLAVGIVIAFGIFDNTLDTWMREQFGIITGLLLTGTMISLIFAYLVRFLAVTFNTIDAGLTLINRSLDDAAYSLGRGPLATLRLVHLPMLRGSLLTAMVLVFVDVLKELPATLILRPFNVETLAVRVYRLASDERLAEASTAALTIVIIGIVPIILLCRAIARSRPGYA